MHPNTIDYWRPKQTITFNAIKIEAKWKGAWDDNKKEDDERWSSQAINRYQS
jgi:hypothetical protein